MGSVRFGAYENFKKEIAHLKGDTTKPADLHQTDKTIAAFMAGLVSSVLVVEITSISVPSNTPGSEFRSKRDKLINSTLVQLMQQSKSPRLTESKGY